MLRKIPSPLQGKGTLQCVIRNEMKVSADTQPNRNLQGKKTDHAI